MKTEIVSPEGCTNLVKGLLCAFQESQHFE
uniref:Uncharacterized protein n=1 Tax=Rhizophora mucronata TaxID=61149 RepID=A0A2P2Q5F3_RHIMU